MRLLLLTLLTTAFLSGCVFEDQPLEAHATLAAANGHADERLPDSIFVGMAGIEGDLDIERLEQEMDEADDELDGLDDAFNLRVPQGTIGDGLPGSWFSLHVLPDEWFFSAALLTQVGTDGVLGSYLWDEREMEAEAEAEPRFEQRLLRLMTPMASSTVATQPDITTHTEEWVIRSGQAAGIAATVPEFRDHVQNETGAEWIYIYIPTFIEDGEEVEDFGNQWVVVHTDLDVWMDGEEATAVLVLIDAKTGEVLEVEVEVPMETITVLDQSYTLQGGLLPSVVTGTDATMDVPFTVTEDMTWLNVDASGEADFELRDAAGTRVDMDTGRLDAWFNDPAPGTWTLTATAESVTPNQEFPFDVQVWADVPA